MFRSKLFEVFNIFDRDWGLATAGTLSDFDGCTKASVCFATGLGFMADYLLKNDYRSVCVLPSKLQEGLVSLAVQPGSPCPPEVREFYAKHGQPTHYEFIGQVEEVIDRR